MKWEQDLCNDLHRAQFQRTINRNNLNKKEGAQEDVGVRAVCMRAGGRADACGTREGMREVGA